MPSKKMPNGMFRDIAHPINTETRNMIDSEVLNAYTIALRDAELKQWKRFNLFLFLLSY